ncbi:hypothetical protein GOP47_0025425 [Adiantum capillus-veneris]|uniref:Uncharacterized protein n=1 Tax=Adiantum capillus-veneris TaxID=13818 RepID=A0A9D4U084_ADICA|nr:hypothetical protein GOP47_0025425 [Adiantum capillus-veneris]
MRVAGLGSYLLCFAQRTKSQIKCAARRFSTSKLAFHSNPYASLQNLELGAPDLCTATTKLIKLTTSTPAHRCATEFHFLTQRVLLVRPAARIWEKTMANCIVDKVSS